MTDEALREEWNRQEGGQQAIDIMREYNARLRARLARENNCPGTGRPCVFYNTTVNGDLVRKCDGCGKEM